MSKPKKAKTNNANPNANANLVKDLEQVQEHYMDYPYPLRNPEDEKIRIIKIYGDCLGELNHWLYRGRESFKDGFRVLVAGGGTGDSAIFLADQLRDIPNAEIVYLDFSKASMAVAQKRAEYRDLTNITWVNDSILNIPNLNLGKFDYINSIGVLHHLASPDLGLKILKDSLTEKGGMGLMVYGQYGRTGVYQLQELMKMVNNNATSRQEEVKRGWAVVNGLPVSNWFVRGKELITDLSTMGDIGMYDLLLHKQDRAYTIPQLYEFAEKAGLNFVDFSDAGSRLLLRLENYISDPELLAELKKRSIVEQQAMCEIITGSIIKHSFFVSNQQNTVASFDDLDNVPYVYTISDLAKNIYEYLEANPQILGGTVEFTWKSDLCGNLETVLPVTNFTKYLFKYMISETLSFREIFDKACEELGEKIEDKILIQNVKNTLTVLQDSGLLLLRNKNVGPFPSLL